MVSAKLIKNEQHIKDILDSLKPYNKYLNTISTDSFEYENICEKIQEQFCEIYEALNISKMKLVAGNLATVDLMNFTMWNYLKNKISFENLLKKLKKYYSSKE